MVGSNHGRLIKAEPVNDEVLLPVALFAAPTPEAAAPPPGGLSVTHGAVVVCGANGVGWGWTKPNKAHCNLLNSVN